MNIGDLSVYYLNFIWTNSKKYHTEKCTVHDHGALVVNSDRHFHIHLYTKNKINKVK